MGWNDGNINITTVYSPKEQNIMASGAFKSMGTVKKKPVTNHENEKILTATYNGNLSMNEFKAGWKSYSADEIASGAEQLVAEAQSLNPGYTVTMYFSYGQYNLDTTYEFEGYQQNNSQVASVWIK